ncbi:hypothetical protein CFC21_089900 [Triticum aestivum]|uniref:Uncharacterized protein n=3 Tax=Triticum TaxID=4564 RepID=A0A9R1BF67_TRITD|nr:uncharacterized protein LOC123139625 [Triticum aestivum]KAF7086616.1 hypothetical protein CFC21_089900 [Triticum aestivum]VAI62400.1 unnamed protein product [Triticum turgidum subsp. durum]
MSKQRRRGEEDEANYYHDRSGNKEKSLYLVLDDWHKGFTIRKIDADSPDLSASPVLRVVSPERGRAMKFAALGGYIIATSNIHAGTLFYDTDTAGLAVGPPIPEALLCGSNTFLTSGAGDTLFAFAFDFMERPVSFEAMAKPPPTEDDDLLPTDWSWRSMPTPFTKDEMIFSYTLHPDRRTIFVFSWSRAVYGTYSVDTRSCKWRRHGEWMLPFRGRGYFDAELDTWVGLHEDGYVCSCQVASRSGGTTQQSEWKMADERRMWIPWH